LIGWGTIHCSKYFWTTEFVNWLVVQYLIQYANLLLTRSVLNRHTLQRRKRNDATLFNVDTRWLIFWGRQLRLEVVLVRRSHFPTRLKFYTLL
jgi:hypothetical protein